MEQLDMVNITISNNKTVLITKFPNYELRYPLFAGINWRTQARPYVATVDEISMIQGHGNTPIEAVKDLEFNLENLYEELMDTDNNDLSEDDVQIKRWLQERLK